MLKSIETKENWFWCTRPFVDCVLTTFCLARPSSTFLRRNNEITRPDSSPGRLCGRQFNQLDATQICQAHNMPTKSLLETPNIKMMVHWKVTQVKDDCILNLIFWFHKKLKSLSTFQSDQSLSKIPILFSMVLIIFHWKS